MMKSIFKPLVLTLSSKKHLIIAIISSLVMAFLAILIPSLLIPSNTIKFQLSLLKINEITLIIIFSALFGISIAMQSYAFFIEKLHKSKLVMKSTGTGFVALTATLFSTKLCPLCLATILGLIGLGSSATLFLFSYKKEILIVSMLLLILVIYITGKRITNFCEKCKLIS